jgi:hypothetical protein
MKTGFLVFITLMLSAVTWGQGESPLCTDRVTGTDTGCTGPHNCVSQDGCTSYNFTAACTGTYFIDAWVTDCTTNSSCKNCGSCVNIYKSGEWRANCHTSACPNGCEYKCDGQSGVNLLAGTQYTMTVCLIQCGGGECSTCGQGCVAHGCVRYGQAATCY